MRPFGSCAELMLALAPRRLLRMWQLLCGEALFAVRMLPAWCGWRLRRRRGCPGFVRDHLYTAGKVQVLLDAVIPPGGTRRGVAVYVHGGAWGSGSPHYHYDLLVGLAEAGYLAVAPAYSLWPKAHAEEMVAEVAAAALWGLERGEDEVLLVGFSAGAQLAATLALCVRAQEWVDGTPLPAAWLVERLGEDSVRRLARCVRRLCLLAGPYHIESHYGWEQRRGVARISPMARAMRGLFADFSPELLAPRIRERRSDAVCPLEVALFHGSADRTVPSTSSVALADALRLVGGGYAVALHTVAGAAHIDAFWALQPGGGTGAAKMRRAVAAVLDL